MQVISSAAKFNNETEAVKEPLDIYILVDPSNSSVSEYSTKSDSLLGVLNDTKLTYPETVTHILILYETTTKQYLATRLDKFRDARSKGSTLKVGVYLNMENVDLLLSIKNQQLPRIDTVLLIKNPTSEEIDGNVTDYVANLTKTFMGTRNHTWNITEQAGRSTRLEIGLMTGWPDTSKSGNISYFKLVKFWKKMNQWASEKEVTVIFDRAFDFPNNRDLYKLTSGWWRVLESTSHSFPSDFVFEEKTSLISDNETFRTVKYTDNITLLNPDKNCEISESNVIWLNPLDFETEKETSKNETDQMNDFMSQVTLVAQKFTTVMVDLAEVKDDDLSLLTKSVVRYNREAKLEKGLKLFLKFRSASMGDLFSNQNRQIMRLVEEADLISSNTLEALLIDEPIKYLLINYDFFRTNKSISYGIVIPLESCTGSRNFNDSIRPYLAPPFKVGYIFLREYPLITDVNRIFHLLTTEVELCRNQILKAWSQQNNSAPQVGFWTGWQAGNEGQIVQMVNYFEKLNIWSQKFNFTVIYEEAFDHPSREKNKSFGWWQLNNAPENVSVKGYTFVEKKSCN